MRTRKILFSLTIIFFFLSANFFAQTFTLPKNISIFQLDNGIQVLLIRKPASPMVGINTVVKVGSAYESFATSGMSHMLEHLLFNGTETMTQQQLYDACDKIGAYNNANTSEYYTNFMMVVPADKIKEGMKIQAGMLFHSTLPLKKFKKEKGIVLEEIAKTLADPQAQAERNANAILFDGHALSLPTLGTYETIKHMKRDDVYRFYKNYYVPNNMIVSVIGNFETAKVLKLLKEIYGKEAPANVEYPSSKNWATGFDKPVKALQTKVFHRFYKGKKLQAMLFYLLPNFENSTSYDLLEKAANEKIDNILTAVNKGKARVTLRFNVKHTPIRSFLQATVSFAHKINVEKTIANIDKAIRKTTFKLTSLEVNELAASLTTSFLKNIEKPHMFGIYNAGKFATEGIEAVLSSYSKENIFKAAKSLEKFKISTKPVIVFQHPFTKGESVAREKVITKPALFMPVGGHPVVIVKTAPGSRLLAIHYLIKNKSKLEAEFGKDAAWIWHDAFGQRMKSPKVKKEALKFGFQFTVNDIPSIPMDDIYLDPNFGYIRVEALAVNIPEAIHFLNQQMLNFVPTKKEFQKALSNLMMAKMFARSKPGKKLFEAKLDSLLYEPLPFKPSEKRVDYESLKKFGEKYFSPANMVISVVGNISPASTIKLFTEFKKGTSYGSAYDKPVVQGFKQLDKPQTTEIKGGGERSYLYFGFQKKIDLKEKPVLKVLSLLLRDKIIFDIREKKGLAYNMSAGVEVRKDKAMFFVDLPTMPQNVDKALPLLSTYFTPAFADSITAEDLQKTINHYIGRMMLRRLSSINQAYYLGHSYYFENNIDYDSEFLNKVKNVSLEAVKAAAKKYLKVENPLTLIVR